jgi:transposase
VRREITRRGGQRPCLRIVRKLFTALADPTGVIAHRRGALERVRLLPEDWADTQRKLVDTETRMLAVLDELELTELVTTIAGLSTIGAAAILAETGAPTRFTTARAPVKHAGLARGRNYPAPSPAAPSSPARARQSYGRSDARATAGGTQSRRRTRQSQRRSERPTT